MAVEAARQEAALRALLTADVEVADGSDLVPNQRDLAARLSAYGTERITVAVPAAPVMLESHVVGEVVDAVAAALDNTVRHGGSGARVWILLDDDGEQVRVSIRDDGHGFVEGRLEQAEADGRFGISHSIVSRITEVGGTASVTSHGAQGVDIELVIPRLH